MDPYQPPPPTDPDDERETLREWIGKLPNGDRLVAVMALLFIAVVFVLVMLGAMLLWVRALQLSP